MQREKVSFRIFLILISILFVFNCLGNNPPKKEFRGVWIATINNVDWPSAPGLPIEIQKKELTDLIDQIEKLNLNVVIFQVRAAADAFYQSETEPWSCFLTGKQGTPPSPFFDPLAFAIDYCHSKGMELHAWINPFRVRNLGHYKLYPGSFAAKHPEYLHEYDSKLYLDPGFPKVRDHLNRVVMEIVRKYNIDAIHFDDYFYPYPISGINYPDQKSFRLFGQGFYPNRQSDWRRDNINRFIAAVHDSIKAVKPFVKLGISPFGVWRTQRDDPNGSPGVKGTTSYDNLYADVYKWLANNWIDYVIPQIYWEQGNRFGDFEVMVKWWNDHCFGKPLYIGQALYKSTGTNRIFENPSEISEQITILRKFGNVGGFALYSASHLSKLSATALNELTTNLLPLLEELPNGGNPVTFAKTKLPPPVAIPESILIADKTSIADTINSRYKSLIDNTLPVPNQFRVIKSRQGWEISWNLSETDQGKELKYSILIFERVKKGSYLKKVLATSDRSPFLVPRKSPFNPARVLFAIVTVNSNGYQGPFSKLFRIRGKRIVIN